MKDILKDVAIFEGNEKWKNSIKRENELYIRNNDIMPTLRSKPDVIDLSNISYISWQTIRNSQTFPTDYNFLPNTEGNVGYICGMSVPPIMIKRIMQRLIEKGLFDYKLKPKKD